MHLQYKFFKAGDDYMGIIYIDSFLYALNIYNKKKNEIINSLTIRLILFMTSTNISAFAVSLSLKYILK